MVIAGIAVLYTGFLVYAAGMQFLVLSAILYGPGTVLYFWTRHEQKKKLFGPIDWGIFLVTAALCILGIRWLATGYITI
jgi:arginine:ornithine antiporter/lysine permease